MTDFDAVAKETRFSIVISVFAAKTTSLINVFLFSLFLYNFFVFLLKSTQYIFLKLVCRKFLSSVVC